MKIAVGNTGNINNSPCILLLAKGEQSRRLTNVLTLSIFRVAK